MLRRERKAQKLQRHAMRRYVNQRMAEDIETSIAIVRRKAIRARKRRRKARGGAQ
jgi:hypothetical protein